MITLPKQSYFNLPRNNNMFQSFCMFISSFIFEEYQQSNPNCNQIALFLMTGVLVCSYRLKKKGTTSLSYNHFQTGCNYFWPKILDVIEMKYQKKKTQMRLDQILSNQTHILSSYDLVVKILEALEKQILMLLKMVFPLTLPIRSDSCFSANVGSDYC